MKRAAIHNLGCKVNAYEAEAMQQLLEQEGYQIVPFSETADVYVINTCSVTHTADQKSRQMIHRARKLNPHAVVVAAGCYVQTAQEKVREDGTADLLIGNNRKHELIAMLKAYETRRESLTDLSGPSPYESLSIRRSAEHTRAFLKVQDGCNQFCSYCIIPYARGRVRSRSVEEVMEEAKELSCHGHQELVLTGIHLSSYGQDLGTDLLTLIRRLHEIPAVRRIRLGSLEPKIVTEAFARALAGLPKVCPHFHLSLQSGCDAVLRRMNRKYTSAEYRECCAYLRRYFEHPALTTDVIVGFPQETEEEFEQTRSFLREIGFFEVHVFPYSRRQGTKAAELAGQVQKEVKTRRSRILLEDTQGLGEAFALWYQGRRVEVLLEEEAVLEGTRCMVGHTPEYVRAAVFDPDAKANQLVQSKVAGVLADHVLKLSTSQRRPL